MERNSLFLENGEYRYLGQQLRPSIMKEIMISELYGKRFKRVEAISVSKKYHFEHGGNVDETKNYVSVFKGACRQLKARYNIQSIGYGQWILNSDEKENAEILIVEEEKDGKVCWPFSEEIGEGKFSVYVYYYDTYKKYASLCHEEFYPCKIGRTDISHVDRIIGQAGTCYPELPVCALLIKCSDSALMENAIHNILKIRGKWLDSAPGKEWFKTNIEEIKSIYYSIMNV